MKFKLKKLLFVCVLVLVLSACATAPVEEVPAPLGLQVVYMSPVDAPELWRVPASGGEAVQLTETDGGVYDFVVSPFSDWIVYAVENETAGIDLWLLELATSKAHKLLDCSEERCIEASWSPDGEYVVFTRLNPSQQSLWIAAREDGTVTPLLSDGAPDGYSPSWSPDGEHVAFVEGNSDRIRIISLQGGENYRLPGIYGLMGNWSPDGTRLVYVSKEEEKVFAGDEILIASVETGKVTPLVLPEFDHLTSLEDAGELEHGHEIDLEGVRIEASVPVWHPTEELLLLAQRPFFATFSKQLWLLPLDEDSQTQPVTDDHNFVHAAYSWSPDGEQVVFQRFALEQTNAVPQVWVWQRESGEVRMLADNAALPQWLP